MKFKAIQKNRAFNFSPNGETLMANPHKEFNVGEVINGVERKIKYKTSDGSMHEGIVIEFAKSNFAWKDKFKPVVVVDNNPSSSSAEGDTFSQIADNSFNAVGARAVRADNSRVVLKMATGYLKDKMIPFDSVKPYTPDNNGGKRWKTTRGVYMLDKTGCSSTDEYMLADTILYGGNPVRISCASAFSGAEGDAPSMPSFENIKNSVMAVFSDKDILSGMGVGAGLGFVVAILAGTNKIGTTIVGAGVFGWSAYRMKIEGERLATSGTNNADGK